MKLKDFQPLGCIPFGISSSNLRGNDTEVAAFRHHGRFPGGTGRKNP
jgi:hypothetical protein